VLVTLDPDPGNQGRGPNQLHGLPVARTELDGDDACRHG